MSRNRLRILKRYVIDFLKSSSLVKYYLHLPKGKSAIRKCEVVVMFDGRLKHGGISDRLWGILSIYKYCILNSLPFKIYFEHPFRLSDYLVPSHENWEISKSELNFDLKHARPKFISMVSADWKEMGEILKKKLKSHKYQQHIYTNTRILSKEEFGDYFHELFKMSATLKENFEKYRRLFPENYISLTFRFQQLLGDIKEGNFKTLTSDKEKIELQNKCREVIVKLKNERQLPVFLTSDSITFLEYVEDIEDVYLIKEKIIHPDFDDSPTSRVYLKSFLDLFLIANADEVYLANIPPLYRSGFAETAACINHRPYYEITSFDNLDIKRV